MAGANHHEENRQLSTLAGYNLRRAGAIDFLANADITTAATAEDIILDVEAASLIHEENRNERYQFVKALQTGDRLGDFSDSRVAAATSLENLVQQTDASDDTDTNHLDGPMT